MRPSFERATCTSGGFGGRAVLLPCVSDRSTRTATTSVPIAATVPRGTAARLPSTILPRRRSRRPGVGRGGAEVADVLRDRRRIGGRVCGRVQRRDKDTL